MLEHPVKLGVQLRVRGLKRVVACVQRGVMGGERCDESLRI